jgi:hypothetical protein
MLVTGEVDMRRLSSLLLLAALLLTPWAGRALEPDKDGFFHTGEGIRIKKVAFIHVKVYDIVSLVKQLPPSKSKEAMISLDADKKLAWKLLRTVDSEKIRKSLRESYAKNGYGEQSNAVQHRGHHPALHRRREGGRDGDHLLRRRQEGDHARGRWPPGERARAAFHEGHLEHLVRQHRSAKPLGRPHEGAQVSELA